MHKVIVSLVILAAIALVSANSYKPTYYPFGPVADVSEASLVGWRKCFEGDYNGLETISPLISDCTAMGEHLLVACRPMAERNGGMFTVLAVGSATAVTTDTGNNYYDTTVDNGVGWYYNEDQSVGFIKEGDFLQKDSCDWWNGNYTELKLCWHAGSGLFSDGYRCGFHGTDDSGENLGSDWSREIWAPIDPCAGLQDGDECDDFNNCTTSTTCQAGVCTGTTVECSQCEKCDALMGCTSQATDGDSCDDGDTCTESDTCQSGVCAGTNTCPPEAPVAAPVSAPVSAPAKAPQAKSSTAGAVQSGIAALAFVVALIY